MIGALLVLGDLAVAPARSPSPAALEPRIERTIELVSPGRTAVRLDRAVYEGARADLGDLRVVDDRGEQVPFLIERGEAPDLPREERPQLRNRAWRSDGSASAVLDFGGRRERRRLTLELSGRNFRRRVTVEGSGGQEDWRTVVDDAWVFAVPAAGPALEPVRYETIDLPANDFPLLRVTVHPGPDERQRIEILSAHVPAGGEPPRREESLSPRWSRIEDANGRETWLLLELGPRHQPFHALELDVPEERFFREVVIEARRAGGGGLGAPAFVWIEIGRGAVYRLEQGGREGACLRLPVRGRERALRLRLRNGDDRPLPVRGVTLHVPIERLVFEAAEGRRYSLRYGAAALTAPAFDLARTVRDVPAWADAAREGSLGSVETRLPGAASPQAPWTERHPALLWAGLLAVVAALGALTYGALRKA